MPVLVPIAGAAALAAGPAIGAAVGSAIAGAVIAAALSAAITIGGQLLFGQDAETQSKSRTREFNPHPSFRFAFGEFPLEGSVLFHHVDGRRYYVVYLLNSVPSAPDVLQKLVIQEHTDLQIDELGDSIYDMQTVDPNPTASAVWNEDDFLIWIGRGDHTQAPQQWLDEIGDVIGASDTWAGMTVAFARFSIGNSEARAERFAFGKPPPLRFFGKWSKLYDPRLDPTSGVTQIGQTVLAIQATPPGSPSDGDAYIVAASATGDWAGQEDSIASWDADSAAWGFDAPGSGDTAWNLDDSIQYTWDASISPAAWVAGQAAHDYDDATTWEWSSNPALAGLMLATHRFALGFSPEIIPIQQWADAADAAGECRSRLVDAALYIALDVSASMDGAKIEAQAEAVANLLTELKSLADADQPNDIRIVLYNDGVVDTIERRDVDEADYDALIAFAEGATTASGGTDFAVAVNSAPTFFDGAGAKERLLVFTTDGEPNPESTATTAKSTLDGIANLARHAFNIELEDTIFTELIDNTGGVPVVPAGDPDLLAIEFLGAVGLNRLGTFCCDGLVTIKQRELEMLDPVLACMAGHLDTTDGLLGVRAGVWEAPTETLPQPIGDEVEVKGARDAGFDTVRSTFIGPDADWAEEEGAGYALRAGTRIGPLQLPLVADRVQANRLEKIEALRAEPRITVDALWDGQQAHRRIGERVTFSLSGLPRSNSSFVITGKQLITQANDDGFALSTKLTLREDLERTYDFDAADVPDPADSTIIDQPNEALAAPTSVTLEQSDFRSAAGATARLRITVAITQELSERAASLRIETTDGSGFTGLVTVTVEPGVLSYVAYRSPAEVGVTYTARARAEAGESSASAWVTSNSLTIVAPVLDFDPDDFSAEFA